MPATASYEALVAIVADQNSNRLRWPGEKGRGVLVDLFTAARIVALHKSADEAGKAKVERMVAKSSASFMRVVGFVYA